MQQDGVFNSSPTTIWTNHLQSPSCKIPLWVLLQRGLASLPLTPNPAGYFSPPALRSPSQAWIHPVDVPGQS